MGYKIEIAFRISNRTGNFAFNPNIASVDRLFA